MTLRQLRQECGLTSRPHFFWLTAVILVVAGADAHADVSIVPLSLISGFSAYSAFLSCGASLAAVTLIEAFVIYQRESLPALESLKWSAYANLVSTFFGIVLMLMASTWDMFAIVVPLVILGVSKDLLSKLGHERGWKSGIPIYLFSVAMCLGAAYLALRIYPGGSPFSASE